MLYVSKHIVWVYMYCRNILYSSKYIVWAYVYCLNILYWSKYMLYGPKPRTLKEGRMIYSLIFLPEHAPRGPRRENRSHTTEI